MKITREGKWFFSGILKTCLFEKGEKFSKQQIEFSQKGVSLSDFAEFSTLFPVEKETMEKLIETAKALGKDVIDGEVVLTFFGSAPHMEHVAEDFVALGISGILLDTLLVFHAVVPVFLREENGVLIGIYRNQDVEFKFIDLESVDLDAKLPIGNEGRMALVHFGSIFDNILSGSAEEKILLNAQGNSEVFMNTCRKVKTLDCGKLLRALQNVHAKK